MKTQQTHVTKSSPTQRRRPILNVQLKIRLLNLELHQLHQPNKLYHPKRHQLKTTIAKKSTTVNKTRTTTKTQPTIRKSSTTSTRSKQCLLL